VIRRGKKDPKYGPSRIKPESRLQMRCGGIEFEDMGLLHWKLRVIAKHSCRVEMRRARLFWRLRYPR